MMAVMPTGVIAVETGIIPRVVPYVTIEAIMTAPMVSPMITIMIRPMMVPRTPPEGIAHHIIPIMPVVRRGEHVGIHAIVIDIPLPTGP